MGDELRGDSLVHLNVRFSTEAELKQTLDFLYVKSKEGISFTGLIEAMVNEVTIVTLHRRDKYTLKHSCCVLCMIFHSYRNVLKNQQYTLP